MIMVPKLPSATSGCAPSPRARADRLGSGTGWSSLSADVFGAFFVSLFILFLLVWSPICEQSLAALKRVPRSDTVIFDAYGRIANPFVFNWMVPGVTRSHGMHQSVWEPLFILNYYNAPQLIQGLMFCYALNTAIVWVITNKWKISIHAIGLGGPLVAFWFNGIQYPILMLSLMIILCLSRIVLKAHTPMQVIVGSLFSLSFAYFQLKYLFLDI